MLQALQQPAFRRKNVHITQPRASYLVMLGAVLLRKRDINIPAYVLHIERSKAGWQSIIVEELLRHRYVTEA
jgi:hypothetical protein